VTVVRAVLAPPGALLGAALSGAVGVLLVTLLAPLALGWRPVVVLTGSMRPAIAPGDLVLAEPLEPARLRPGDVVTFPDPSRGGRLVTHRVRALEAVGDAVEVTTRGDANAVGERWRVRADDAVGRTVLRLPLAGHVLAVGRTPEGRLALVVAPALLLAALLLVRIWRTPAPPPAPAVLRAS
jgi:signal peptidase